MSDADTPTMPGPADPANRRFELVLIASLIFTMAAVLTAAVMTASRVRAAVPEAMPTTPGSR